MKKYLAAAALLALLPGIAAAGDGDWQIWFGGSASGKIVESLKLDVEETAYYSDDAREVTEHYFQPRLIWSASPWLDLAGGCRFIFKRTATGWAGEDRPLGEATLKTDLEGWKLKNRLQIAYRSRSVGNDLWLLRNKGTVTLPWKLTDWGISPYVADEIFFEQEQSGLYRNRVYAGFTVGEFFGLKTLGGDFYFMWDATEKDEGWVDTYVVGLMARLKL